METEPMTLGEKGFIGLALAAFAAFIGWMYQDDKKFAAEQKRSDERARAAAENLGTLKGLLSSTTIVTEGWAFEQLIPRIRTARVDVETSIHDLRLSMMNEAYAALRQAEVVLSQHESFVRRGSSL